MSCCYNWVRVLEVFGAVFVSVIAAGAAIMGAIPFTQCNMHSFLDTWLIVFGITAAAVVIGVAIWRSGSSIYSYINGHKYLLIVLLAINIIWLIIGNVLVVLYYEACGTLPDELVEQAFDVTCSFYQLPFALAIVVVADFIYIVLIFTCCCKGECCNDCHCICCKKSAWSVYWALILGVVFFLIVSIVAIAIGATYFDECYEEDWAAIWLIVLGVVGVFAVCVSVCWWRCKPRLNDSWVTPSLVLPLPLIVILVVLFAIITVGNVWLLQIRDMACDQGDLFDPCNTVLRVFTIVTIILLNFPTFVLAYIGVILLILIIFFMFMTCCYYCTHDRRKNRVDHCKLQDNEA